MEDDEVCANCFYRLISNTGAPACYKKKPIKITALYVEREKIDDDGSCDLFTPNGRMGR